MANWGEVGTFRVGIEITGGTAGAKKIVYASGAIDINDGGLKVDDTTGRMTAGKGASTAVHAIVGTGSSVGGGMPDAIIGIYSKKAMGAGVGAGLYFSGKYTVAGAEAVTASISSRKVNGTDGGTGANFGFNLDFYTLNQAGSYIQPLQLGSDGAIQFGPTSNDQLHDLRVPTAATSTEANGLYVRIKINGTTKRLKVFDDA